MTNTEKLTNHRDLDVWKISIDFVVDLYDLTESFPKDERFGLVAQLRRAGVSICSNIAEGASRQHKKEFIQFLYTSLGSATEIETQLEIASRLNFVKSIEKETQTLMRVKSMLRGLIKKISTP